MRELRLRLVTTMMGMLSLRERALSWSMSIRAADGRDSWTQVALACSKKEGRHFWWLSVFRHRGQRNCTRVHNSACSPLALHFKPSKWSKCAKGRRGGAWWITGLSLKGKTD
jgi:hypothetical protein